jgi:hypothetical protein
MLVVINIVSDIVLLETGQRELDGNVTVRRKLETSSSVILTIHRASFPGLDILRKFLWDIYHLICFSALCVLILLDAFILRMQTVQYSTVHNHRCENLRSCMFNINLCCMKAVL